MVKGLVGKPLLVLSVSSSEIFLYTGEFKLHGIEIVSPPLPNPTAGLYVLHILGFTKLKQFFKYSNYVQTTE